MTETKIDPHGICATCLEGRSLPLLGTGEQFASYCVHTKTLAMWSAYGRWTETHPIGYREAHGYLTAHCLAFVTQLKHEAESDDPAAAAEARRRLALVDEWQLEIERILEAQRGPTH